MMPYIRTRTAQPTTQKTCCYDRRRLWISLQETTRAAEEDLRDAAVSNRQLLIDVAPQGRVAQASSLMANATNKTRLRALLWEKLRKAHV